jgi:hypothetical protein
MGLLGETIDAYVLPHLPLRDAAMLQEGAGGNYNITNLPHITAKLPTATKLQPVSPMVLHLKDLARDLLVQMPIKSRQAG